MKHTTIKNIEKNMKYITRYYRRLTYYTRQNLAVGSINEWIVDNYYLLSEQEQTIKHELSSIKILQIKPKRRQYLDNLVNGYLEGENYKLDTNLLFVFLNKYQKEDEDYFTYDEIDYINSAIKCNIISKLKNLTERIGSKFFEKERLDACFKKLLRQIEKKQLVDFNKCMPLDGDLVSSPFKITEINHRISGLGEFAEEAFIKLNELLQKNNTTLKEIIDLEHEERTYENLLMVNLISSFKVAIRFKLEDLYTRISFVEKALINEKAGIYDKMYEVSKIEYRRRIKYWVRKKRKKEYHFIIEMLEKADEQHIGFLLFPEKNYNLRTWVYILVVVFLTLGFSYLAMVYLGMLAFFLFLIPSCGFAVEVINQILMKKVDTQTLFRIKLENHLPKEYSSMIVIPTIVQSTEKVNEMFDNLELFYLSNRTENLYFCLLGDVTGEKSAKVKNDEKIVKIGLEKAKLLNDRYGKEIFYFIYRNRFFNEKEDNYLGYERKRGAIKHFNQLLLGRLSEKEKEKYFRCHTFANFKTKIKYVITLDADTKLLLNTALKLIGTMVHPMHKPILSDDGMRVVKGYGIMQPRVSIDVEVTNKSEYSQLFAGLGGLDIYSTKQFDLYQDVFGEGSFTGKGIYDLETFDKLLGNTFPENLILSHDLIEGNYLRCGYISDVELFDGFPSKYLNDAMRHHRWTRGDWQIISWLKKYVRNVKNDLVLNPINSIGKFKIFDNLRRSLRSPFLFLILIYGFSFSKSPGWTLASVLIIIAVPIFFYLLHHVLSRQKYDVFLRYYLRIIWGILAVLAKSIIVLALLPYEAYLYLDAITKSLYRMYVSRRNLLNWITSEEVEATSKNTLGNYIKNFRINYVAAIVLILLTYYLNSDALSFASFVAIIWVIAPILMSFVSQDIVNFQEKPTKKMESDIREIAGRTWLLFEKYLVRENNYLVPDNYQENRNQKADSRTSPTNIGFSLIAIVSACELKIISQAVAVDKINNVVKTVEGLKKWNGHLYNWYDIKYKKELSPFFISTADSGNFVSGLYVVRGFLEQFGCYKSLKYRIKKLIDETDFSKLYNEEGDVFSIGYIVNEGSLVPYNYNNFLSEARLASFVAIAKGDVPFKHWFRLDKTLTKYKWSKGVVSWSGTMFEYYMPLIFMKTFEHTLLDETYAFAYYAHREFMREVNPKLPFGLSESAYNELDDSQNYKYKAFGIPYLKFHDSEIPQIVVSPYGSMMALGKYPVEVYNNIKKFKKLGMGGEFGLYEAYDYEDDAIVKAYYAHHQGMILASITNYLKDNVIQDYFHADKQIQSVEILLKEKVQIRTYIDLKIARYKKYNYKRDIYENDMREQEGIMPIPEVGILSNGFYTTFINDRGLGFSRYKNLQINRYRKHANENYGIFVYLKNKKNNKIWSNTYSPLEVVADHYHVVFASDRIKIVREDDQIITSTEIVVTKDHNAEIRRIKVENTSDKTVDLELTSYGEMVIARPEEDIAHRVFNSMTINCEIDEVSSSLIFNRKSRTKTNTRYFIINRFFCEDDDGLFQYETSRLNFIGRNNNSKIPNKIIKNEKLTSNCDLLLDPIMSIRKKVSLEPGSKKILYLLVGFGKSKEQVIDIVNVYNSAREVDLAFEKTTIFNNMRNKYANLNGNELRAYHRLLKYVYQPIFDYQRKELLPMNTLNQQSLWKFGVSGDLPIILVDVFSAENSGFIDDLLRAYEFYQNRAIYVDVVIINNEDAEKRELVRKSINRIMYRINSLNEFDPTSGKVLIIEDVTEEERILLKTVASLYFDGSLRKSLSDQINELEEHKESVSSFVEINDMVVLGEKDILSNYGRFLDDGREFLVKTTDTPMPWSNVLVNENFGTVITNNFGGFTYAYNSREFKLTSWSNDFVSDPSSEKIYFNHERVIPSEVRHGIGYSVFVVKTKKVSFEITVFVPTNDNVKIYDIKILAGSGYADFEFDFIPVLGVSEEITARHLVSEFDEKNNCVMLKNVYSKEFKQERVFVGSSERIINCKLDKIDSKSISVNFDLKNTKRFCFTIGCGNDEEVINKYRDLGNVDWALVEVKEKWNERLGKLKIKTPDDSLNYLVNDWLLYQVYASRLCGRAAFYQVGGAIGFRDQLQDTLCLLYSNPDYTKKQILKHANHQFVEGDVLHWWHEETSFGVRTRFSDDYLWLIYVTYEYLKTTDDYSILEEKVGFVDGEMLFENEMEKGIVFSYSSGKESLYYHLKLAISLALERFGENELPLIGAGDWNDGMNKVGSTDEGESVWVGFFLYDLLLKMAEISVEIDLKENWLKRAQDLKETINRVAWDGEWYLRAFFDDGTLLGSHENKECQIDLISQAWSMLTGVVDQKRMRGMIGEVEKRLVDKEAEIIKLLTPAFTGLEKNPGYISEYLSGIRENGAQYTHAALWYIMALAKVGETKKAYQHFKMINPINRKSEIYKVEPYVMAGDIYSNPNFLGQGGWTWYTGSASWAYKVILESLIGITKVGDKLHIKPNFDPKWEKIEIEYQFGNSRYFLTVYYADDEYVVDLIDDQKEHKVVLKKEEK